MRELMCVIGRFGAWLGIIAFGLGLAGALVADVDPLFAVLRAGGLAVALVAFYAAMCRALMPWLRLEGSDEELQGDLDAAAAPSE